MEYPIALYNGKQVTVKEDVFYIAYDIETKQKVDQCRKCGKLAYRDDLQGDVDTWVCPFCADPDVKASILDPIFPK